MTQRATFSSGHIPSLRLAFTLPELMITMALFSLVALVDIYTHVFGLRMNELTQTRMGTGSKTRAALQLLMEEVRTAHRVQIGNGGASSFTEIPIFTAQNGNAIQVYPGSATNVLIRYYLDNGTDQLMKVDTNGVNEVVARGIGNALVFRAEDSFGTILPNNFNNRVIALNLDFYQLDGGGGAIGSGYLYDAFRLTLQVTRRALQ